MFDRIPKKVCQQIARKLSVRDALSYTQTCHLLRSACGEDLLFPMAIHGQLAYVVGLVSANPELLRRTATFVDASLFRTHVDRTVYQFFLGSEDLEACEALTPIFSKLGEQGEAERVRQIAAQFPEPLTRMACTPEFTAELAALLAAFEAATTADIDAALVSHKSISPAMNPLIVAIQQFRNGLRQKLAITTGWHFNMANFEAVLNVYHANKMRWSFQHCRLFSIKVIADMVKLLPRRYQMACLQGLRHVVTECNPLKRPLFVDYTAGGLFPGENTSFDLGEDFFLDHVTWPVNGGSIWRYEHNMRLAGFDARLKLESAGLEMLTDYVESTLMNLQNLCDRPYATPYLSDIRDSLIFPSDYISGILAGNTKLISEILIRNPRLAVVDHALMIRDKKIKRFNALLYACNKGDFQLAILLLRHGAKANVQCTELGSPLHALLARGCIPVLAKECITSLTDFPKRNWQDYIELLQLLLPNGGSQVINVKKLEQTPLYILIYILDWGREDDMRLDKAQYLVNLFLMHGADPLIESKWQYTCNALQLAIGLKKQYKKPYDTKPDPIVTLLRKHIIGKKYTDSLRIAAVESLVDACVIEVNDNLDQYSTDELNSLAGKIKDLVLTSEGNGNIKDSKSYYYSRLYNEYGAGSIFTDAAYSLLMTRQKVMNVACKNEDKDIIRFMESFGISQPSYSPKPYIREFFWKKKKTTNEKIDDDRLDLTNSQQTSVRRA